MFPHAIYTGFSVNIVFVRVGISRLETDAQRTATMMIGLKDRLEIGVNVE